ncbi:MAG: hypothetical protein C0615_04295 [Desulfuromonas sp.]|nr:MAG: hypothetical protein C0615_04295 [Desulfuromonas sp.]
MKVVVVDHTEEVTQEQVQTLAEALGVTAFDARQRLVCQGPVVVSTQADDLQAETFLHKLRDGGFEAFIVDVETAQTKRPVFFVKSFVFGSDEIRFTDQGGRNVSIPYPKIRLILPSLRSMVQTETNTVTEKKLSVGKTLMTGGIPMTKKVTRKETITTDDRERMLYLCANNGARVLCGQESMSYEGFGGEMKPSREMNFNMFVTKIRESCPDAVFDERLAQRAGQVKLLGPTLNPDTYIDLAVDILVASFSNNS